MHPVFPNLILFSHVHHFVKRVVFCHGLEMFPLQAGSRGISGPSCSYRSEYCPVSGTPVIDCSLNWCTCCVLCPKDLCQFVECTTVYSSLSFLSLPLRNLLRVTQTGDISYELSFCMVIALIFIFSKLLFERLWTQPPGTLSTKKDVLTFDTMHSVRRILKTISTAKISLQKSTRSSLMILNAMFSKALLSKSYY